MTALLDVAFACVLFSMSLVLLLMCCVILVGIVDALHSRWKDRS